MEKLFYKIEKEELQIGSGDVLPDGFTEYVVGREPLELKEALQAIQVEKELQTKIQEAARYLKDTDWVSNYKIRHDLGLELIIEDSSKWLIINQREIYILFLKSL